MSDGLTTIFRIILLVVAVALVIAVTKKVRNSKIKLEDSILWFVLSLAFFVVSVFPQIFDFIASLVGVYSTTNLVFLIFIALLIYLCFRLSIKQSQTETKLKELAQEIAIEKFERHNKN